MRSIAFALLFAAFVGAPALPAGAWPAATTTEIFRDAGRVLPGPLRQLLQDMEATLDAGCVERDMEEAVGAAIAEFSKRDGNLVRAVEAMRDAGCAAAALNDPGMDALVEAERERFAVVFYGPHPALEAGDVGAFVEARTGTHRRLLDRFGRSSRLPNRSTRTELSPEFGMASIAYSHAVTDVANVWLYVWRSVNGAWR